MPEELKPLKSAINIFVLIISGLASIVSFISHNVTAGLGFLSATVNYFSYLKIKEENEKLTEQLKRTAKDKMFEDEDY